MEAILPSSNPQTPSAAAASHMDHRRPPRTVIDPKVRQVGFITPGDPPLPRTTSEPSVLPSSPPTTDLSTGSSLSPVMIPPPRTASASVPVPNPPMSPLRRESHMVMSYTPSELGVESSPTATMSPTSRIDARSEFSEDIPPSARLVRTESGRAAAPLLPGNRGETAAVKVGSLTTASVVKVLPGVSETDEGALVETHTGVGVSKPSKQKPTKAERRALQEAQRAAKNQLKESGGKVVRPPPQKKDVPLVTTALTSEKKAVDRLSEKERKKDVPHPRMQFDDKHRVDKAKRRAVVNQSEARNRVELFRHLPQYVYGSLLPDLESKFFQLDPMHPSVYKVGLQYLSGDISGGNARCIAMLVAFRESIKDYATPPEKVLTRDLAAKISSYVSFLIECRPLSISMGNAIKFLKSRIAKLPLNLSETEAKGTLQSDIDRFINEKIVLADKVIVRHAVTKIRDGDVLLTYGSPFVVEMIFLYAHENGIQFRVVVVDSRPKLEGQALFRRLVGKGINCTYTHINAISYIMHEVTRVFLGASSVLSNGTVYSRVGTACVAMVAHAFRIPVLICCEAYKFHERVQLDSICSNELGDPDVISKIPGRKELNYLDNWSDNENLQLLNLSYDATPSDYVSMIITDYGMLPPTSVPVIVREYRRENLWI